MKNINDILFNNQLLEADPCQLNDGDEQDDGEN